MVFKKNFVSKIQTALTNREQSEQKLTDFFICWKNSLKPLYCLEI